MKNLMLLVLGTVLLTVSGCGGDGVSAVSNKKKAEILEAQLWVLATAEIMDDLVSNGANSTRLNIVEPSLKRLEFATFKFSDGNKLELNLNNGTAPTFGTYKFLPNGKILDMAFGSRPAIAHEIISITDKKIILGDDTTKGLMFKKILIPFDPEKAAGSKKEDIITPEGASINLNKNK